VRSSVLPPCEKQWSGVFHIRLMWAIKHVPLYYGCDNFRVSWRLLTLLVPGGSTFLREVTTWPPSWNYDVVRRPSRNPTHQLMQIGLNLGYLKKNLAEFHPDPIWNDGALGFFEDGRPNNNKNNNNRLYSTFTLLTRWVAIGLWDQFLSSWSKNFKNHCSG